MKSLIMVTVAAFVLSTGIRSQTASYQVFGRNDKCAKAGTLSVVGVPKLGSTFHLRMIGHGNQYWTLNGTLLHTSMRPISKPFDLSVLSVPGPWVCPKSWCGSWYLDKPVHVIWAPPWKYPNLLVLIPFRVPNDTTLLGLTFYQQALTYGASGKAWCNIDATHAWRGVVGR